MSADSELSEKDPWGIYDEYRTARLNVHYYSAQLASARRSGKAVEWILAIAASSSVGGLWLFSTFLGGLLWRGVGGVAALLAVYQVVVRPKERVAALEQRVTLWRGLEFDLDRLVKRIAALRGLPPDVDEQLELILSRKRELVLSYVDPKTDQKLLAESHGRVNAELPPNSFWKP